jgi:D-sedoheptulose 7-phosphate isomerase
MREEIIRCFNESTEVKQAVVRSEVETIEQITEMMVDTYKENGKVIAFGNGGSAADAQHIVAELMSRFEKERRALPAIALSTNSSTVTAIANDYDYDLVFSRQLEVLLNNSDAVIGISTSGNSRNVIKAIELANAKGAKTIALTGGNGGKLAKIATIALTVPSNSVARIQEVHITIIHIVCMLIEKWLAKP